jgi:hypothetical protein
MDYFATEFYDLKDALVIAEMQILKRLGFQTQCGLTGRAASKGRKKR